MSPKDIEWEKLGFGYTKTPFRYHAYWKDGNWGKGKLINDNKITIAECATALHYGQQCFEGMKAQRAKDGTVYLFRPYENAKRMRNSASRLRMAQVPEDMFVDAVKETVNANIDYVPPYGLGASLYIRPLLIGIGENLGVHPAPEYLFLVFVVPVGPYFKEGFKPIKMKIETDYDRAAPQGIGNVKAGGNYSAGLLPVEEARREGYAEVVYLDAKEHKYFEECGAANILFVFKDGSMATPESAAILPSITRRSLVDIAREDFDIDIVQRKVSLEELDNIEEAGACGTAAVITPIGSMGYQGELHTFYAEGKEPGPTLTKLYKQLTALQVADVPDKRGWLEKVA